MVKEIDLLFLLSWEFWKQTKDERRYRNYFLIEIRIEFSETFGISKRLLCG